MSLYNKDSDICKVLSVTSLQVGQNIPLSKRNGTAVVQSSLNQHLDGKMGKFTLPSVSNLWQSDGVENSPKVQSPPLSGVKLSPAGRWSVSLLVDVEIEPLPECSNKIGVDLGITSLVALSTGEKIANPKCFNAKRRKLKKAQKALSSKQKGSNNRYKARLKVAKVHQEISDARKDFLHKLTTRWVRENQTIAVEDLAQKNMI